MRRMRLEKQQQRTPSVDKRDKLFFMSRRRYS
jgi:hypothetical protein